MKWAAAAYAATLDSIQMVIKVFIDIHWGVKTIIKGTSEAVIWQLPQYS